MFWYGCEKYLTLNRLTIVTLDKILMTEETEVTTISMIPDKTVNLDQVYYHGIYFLLHFKRQEYSYSKDDQADMEADPDEEQMWDVIFGEERECQWRIFLGDNQGGVDGQKDIIHANSLDV